MFLNAQAAGKRLALLHCHPCPHFAQNAMQMQLSNLVHQVEGCFRWKHDIQIEKHWGYIYDPWLKMHTSYARGVPKFYCAKKVYHRNLKLKKKRIWTHNLFRLQNAIRFKLYIFNRKIWTWIILHWPFWSLSYSKLQKLWLFLFTPRLLCDRLTPDKDGEPLDSGVGICIRWIMDMLLKIYVKNFEFTFQPTIATSGQRGHEG